ncbi:MAG: DNA-directed DNA polymerase II small subunit [Candidatus Bathyarchaeota archaeon]|nr:DNA-directed DNA polymerase II small subunit [Candidatus Bathyarchaeota archaeon]MDH5788312.1 DNA-directed DNA polymerase II small subunit [Candidatus Bathyarchaeota archaeon]
MSTVDKLQKAVEATIAAGYQLNKDAFEFLSLVAAAEDPTDIINRAIQKIEGLKEKPFFIDRDLLEQLVKESEPSKEISVRPPEETLPALPETRITEGKREFHPYAKEVEANINIIEDPSTKLSSNGKIEDYLEYFRDRYRRLERLLRQRIDVRAAASIIDALKAPANTKLKIIAMVTEKRESKKRLILKVEDLYASATVLFPQNVPKELMKSARLLLLDQVVCLSVVKTRSTLLIAEDITLPDIAQRPQHKASSPVHAVLTSDMHIGSLKFQKESFNRFILWLNGKYGDEKMRELAGHVKYVLIAGDIVDGIGVYPNQLKELAVKDVHKQYRLAAKYLEQIPDYIEVMFIPGNHDTPRKALPQPAISNTFIEPLQEARKVYSLGNPCLLSLHNVEVLLYHGRSLDDITSTIPDADHNHPEKAMKLLLQSRHLAPVYGEKTMLSPENRDFLVIEHVPDIFHAGHVHVLGYTNYRSVLIVNSGGWQEQTEYMKMLGLVPTPGNVPVVNLQTLEVTVVPFI